MTGLDPERDQVCEVAVVLSTGGVVEQRWQRLVRPEAPMSKGALRVHGLTPEKLRDAPSFAALAEELAELLDDRVVVAHNVSFDLTFLHREFERVGRPLLPPVTIDTLDMSRRLFAFRKNNLGAVCAALGLTLDGAHRAMADAEATHAVFERMVEVLDPEGTVTVLELHTLLGVLAPNSPYRLQQQKLLTEAYEGRRTVFIDYQSTDAPLAGVVHREIAIWRLRLPYVQAWCYVRSGERVFRLDRIRTVSPGERGYEIPDFKPRI